MPMCDEQWECMACGFANGFVRIRCRNCGSAQFEGAKLKPNPILPVAADRDPGPTEPDRTCPHGCYESDGHPSGCTDSCPYCASRRNRPESYRVEYKSRLVANRLANDIRRSPVHVLRFSDIERETLLTALDRFAHSEIPEHESRSDEFRSVSGGEKGGVPL